MVRSATLPVALVAFAACGSSSSAGPPSGSADASPDAVAPGSDAFADGSSGGVTVVLGDAPTLGPASAKVVVVEFGDFECPYCGAEEPVVEQLRTDYAGKVLFSFKEFPIASIHPYAELAAEAALAANAQGEFWPYHDKLYANQSSLGRASLDSYAQSLGLDLATFDAALDAGTYKAAVAADLSQGVSLGVNATPTFFVNGKAIVGAVPYSELQAAIDAALAANP